MSLSGPNGVTLEQHLKQTGGILLQSTTNTGLMLGQRRRRWASIETALD